MVEPRAPRAESFLSALARILLPVAWATVLSACESVSPVVSYEYRPQLGFVRIERIEAGAPDNAHPFTISADALRRALASLEVDFRMASAKPVFTDEELAEIVPHLSAALAKAAPKEDITFAVIGRHGTFGDHSPRSVTTGRLFVRERELNVVFGLIHQPFEQRYQENELGPGALSFPPGSRAYQPEGFWKLVPKTGRLADKRVDWVMLDPLRAGPAAAAPAADGRYQEIQNRLSVLNRLKADGLITEEEYGERRRAILQGL